MNKTALRFGFLLAIALASVQGQVADVVGQWRVVPREQVAPPSTPFEEWVRALPGAIFTFAHADIPPLAMIRKDLGYTYFPSLPTLNIYAGKVEKPYVLGFLQSPSARRFEGELAFTTGCWVHLSLEESEDGLTLAGTGRINTKVSTRSCRNDLVKDVKKGAPFDYRLVRLR